MSSDTFNWHSYVVRLRRVQEAWARQNTTPGITTAAGSLPTGSGILSVMGSMHLSPGVMRSLPGYETYNRVQNVVKAIEDAEPVAFNTIGAQLRGITLDDVKPILFNIVKDIALYVGGSTVVGAGIGGGLGALAFGAGAIPGAMAGAAIGAEVGNLILTFTGLKSIAIYMKDAVPAACREYTAGFKEAWGPQDFSRPPYMVAATNDFAKGHVLFLMALIMGIVAYLTRGKGNLQSLLAEVRGSTRLGPKMAAWLERNEDKLLNNPELRPGMRSEGVGGGGDAPAPTSSMPRPMRGGSSAVASAAEKVESAATKKAPLFPNQLPNELQDELATAKSKGISPLKIGDPGFDDAINQGTVKYVVTDSGEILVEPKYAEDGTEISHAVLSGGKPVAAAGEADIAGNSADGYIGVDINTHSGHFLDGATAEQNAAVRSTATDAFNNNGITFPE